VWEWDSLKAALEEEHQLCKGDEELQGKFEGTGCFVEPLGHDT
jgi:hypothetical protein